MHSERTRVAAIVFLLVLIEIPLWTWKHDVFVSVYATILGILACFRAFNWPKPSWLGGNHLEYVKHRTAHVELGKINKGATIGQLETNQAAKQFFAAVIYEENNEALCNDIVEHFTPKILYYGLLLMVALFLENPHAATAAGPNLNKCSVESLCGDKIAALKFLTLITSAVLPLLWDYTRYEKQKYWNKELHPSH